MNHQSDKVTLVDQRTAPMGERNTVVRPGSTRKRSLLLILLAGSQFLVVIDETVVNVALPSISGDLGLSELDLSWVVNAYLLTFGGLLLAVGRLGDLLGRRRLLIAGVVLFGASSALAGLADSGSVLVLARGAQGVGAALVSPTALAILTSEFTDPRGRRRALAVWGALLGLGATCGVVLGGMVVEWLSWHWVFFINVPLCAVISTSVVFVVSRDERRQRTSVDLLGAALITMACVAVVKGVVDTSAHPWLSAPVLIPLAVAGGCLALFVARQARARLPLIPRALLKGGRVWVTSTVAALGAAGLFSLFFFVTLWMQLVQQWSPLMAGLAWAPQGITIAIVSAVAARLVPVFGVRSLTAVGLTLAAVAQLLLLRTTADGSYLNQLLPVLIVNAIGLGLAFVPVTVAVFDSAPTEAHGLASGLLSTSQQIGGAIGLAVLATVAGNRFAVEMSAGADQVSATLTSFHTVFLVSAGLMLMGALVSLLLPPIRREVDMTELVG